MKEVNEILSILRRAKQFVEDDDPYGLKNLSGETIQSATISQDADNIIVAGFNLFSWESLGKKSLS